MAVAVFRKCENRCARILHKAFARGGVVRYARQQQPYVAQIAVEQDGVGCGEQQDEA